MAMRSLCWQRLAGPTAPDTWRGALPVTYRIGPGPAKVHLVVKSNWDLKTIYDVIAKIPGSENPDEWVLRGNHHDAWVNGADDPISGMVAELEEARSLGELMKQGWRPKRTVIYCAWDGEEPGLLGSTEWVEEHQEELRQHAVMYLNTDSSARGYLEHFRLTYAGTCCQSGGTRHSGPGEAHHGLEACLSAARGSCR